MREIASLELHLAIKELKEDLEGAFLKKFYEDSKESFRFVFHKADKNIAVHCMLLKSFNSTKYSPEPKTPSSFAMAVRKRIENSKVKRIYQYGTDRIIVIEFSTKDEEYSFVIEMFGRGNVILVKNGIIDLCYKRISYKDREIRSKEPYQIVEGKMSFEETENSIVDLVEHACSEDDTLIRSVSKYMPLGPVYIDDALRMQNIDPKAKAESVDRDHVSLALGYIFSRAADPKPVAYIENGSYYDYSAYPLAKYANMQKESFASMNELLDEFNKKERVEEDTEHSRKVAEVDASIKKQRELSVRFAEEEKAYAEIGRNVLENMNTINALIEEIRKRKKPTLEELNEVSAIKVIGIDLKKKTVTIEI
jgi:predicted ribosome quality control (RQC) complex YloA/Tae2 family protein